MSWLAEMLSYAFIQRALIVGVLISLVAALLGSSLVLRRSSMIGDGLAHTAFGAFAVATVLGFAPLVVAIPVVIIASFVTLRLSRSRTHHSDAAIAVLSASSLAIGVMAISITQGVNIDLNSYLFGSILSVSWGDVWLSLGLAAVVLILFVLTYHRIFAITFDDEFARAIGVRAGVYDAVFAIICSVVIVLGMRLLGALLISSLIIFPALTAMQFARSFRAVVISAAIISVVAFLVGLTISYFATTPTGATVVVVNLIALIITHFVRHLR